MLTDISDHFQVFTVNWSIQEKTVDILEYRIIMSENNYNRFKQYISNCDWQEILTHQDTNIAFESFHMKLKSAYDKVFPKNKITKTCFTGKPWLTEGLKHSIKLKNKLFIQYKKCSSAHNEIKYKIYRNRLNKLIKTAERHYYQEKLENNKCNIKRTWSIVKEVIGTKKSAKIQIKFKQSDGEITAGKKEISHNFNTFLLTLALH